MLLKGRTITLRAVEPEDIDTMYVWENDPEVWRVSGTLAPFSRHVLSEFIEQQRYDIYRTRQLRLMIVGPEGGAVGTLDLFDFEPQHRRAGVGILVYDASQRCKGYASDALDALTEYARKVLGLHQLWCNIDTGNRASIALFRKAGFTDAGIRREWNRTPDGYRDELLLQRIID